MGKSALLRQFVRIAREEGLLEAQIVILDLDSDSYPTAEALAQKLAGAVRWASPEFDGRYRAARARRDEFAPRVRELKEQWVRWETLRGSSDADIDKLLDAHRRTLRHVETQQAGFGEAALPHMAAQAYVSRNELAGLLAFRKERGRVPESLDELLERELGTDDAGLFLHERGLGQALADDLYALAEAAPLLLALDTYELADQHDDWLRTTILANGSSRMLAIVAGRNRHDEDYRRTFSGGLASLVRSYNLNHQTLQDDEVREYLRLRLDADPADILVEEVFQISRGIPLAIEALGDQLAGSGDIAPYRDMQAEGLDRRGVVHRVTERFLRYALEGKGDDQPTREAKRHDRQRIRALSLLLRPDADLACALWGFTAEAAQQVVSGLADRYSFIFAGYAPYEMHDLVRVFVRADTLANGRNGFDWPALAEGLRRALPIIEQRIARAEQRMPDPDERYADTEWCDATLDRLNLLLWLGEDEAAKRLLLNRWIEACHANPEFATQLAELAGELAPKRMDWRELLKTVVTEEYGRLEVYNELIEPHARVMMCYLRAQGEWIMGVYDENDLKHINEQIDLLDQGRALDETWTPIRVALAEAYANRGIYSLNQTHFTEAQVDFEQSLALRPDDPDTLYYRGWVKDELGDYAGALADYDRSLALLPDDPDTLTSRGVAKFQLGDYTGALADFAHSLALRPDDPDTLINSAEAKGKLSDYAGALADYDRALALRPDDPDMLRNRGRVRDELGDFTSAIADYDHALALRPDDPDMLRNRGWVRDELGDFTSAIADYDHALALQPDDPDTFNNRGWAKGKLNDYPGAIADYDRSLALRPDDPNTLHNRALTKSKLNDYTGAIADYDRVLELRPDDPGTLYNRGVAKSNLGDYASALADFDRSLDLRPDDPDTLNKRGYFYAKLGEYDKAISDLHEAIRINPQESMIYCSIAETYILMKNYDTALEWLAQAIQLDPSKRLYTATTPDYDPIRADPRFVALVGDGSTE